MGDFINFSTPHLCSGGGSKNCGCLFQISHRIPSQSCPTSLCMAEVHRNLCSHIIIFQIIFHEHVFCLISVRHVKIVLKTNETFWKWKAVLFHLLAARYFYHYKQTCYFLIFCGKLAMTAESCSGSDQTLALPLFFFI